MKIRFLRNLLCTSVMLTSSACMMWAGSNDTAVLRSSGSVLVNGTSTPATSALFQGDRVQTETDAVVTISSPGSNVLVPANSQVVFHGGVLDVNTGAARISTTKGMSVQADSFHVSPVNGTANFEIKRTADGLLVHASNGALTVRNAGKDFAIAEGETATLNSRSGEPVAPLRATQASYGSLSNASLFKLDDALSFSQGNQHVPFCTDIKVCSGSSVTPAHPCICRRF